MHTSDTIVRPICNARSPRLGALAIMIASQADLAELCTRFELPDTRKLYLSRLHYNQADPKTPALIGPVMGAPYATMLLEIIHAWGARQVVFVGWCGSIHQDVRTGDIILPEGALIDEGTSLHYHQTIGALSKPDPGVRGCIEASLRGRQIDFHQGLIWTTDAIFRETRTKLQAFQGQGAVAVEMELSALFSVAVFHQIKLAGVLAVSDELFTFRWQPGFKSEKFTSKLVRLAAAISDVPGKMAYE